MEANSSSGPASSTSAVPGPPPLAALNAALYERTQILVGDEGIRRLQSANIFLAGCGGVGGHCAEALVRAGVGRITLCDHDVVSSTNKNRQLIALDSTVGKSKVLELCKRLEDISSLCQVTVLDAFLMPEDMVDILQRQRYDVLADCIDSVECKVSLLETAVKVGLKVFSSCGAGGRLDPLQVSIGDLYDTENDGLARACRGELRKRGIGPGNITVVHSKELPLPPLEPQRQDSGGRDRAINGTISYMPPLFGLMLSSAIVRCLVDPANAEKQSKKRLRDAEKKEQQRQKLAHGGSASTTQAEAAAKNQAPEADPPAAAHDNATEVVE
ncbi:ubiquitin-activating enzyme, putative [Bodo saltans]|uniref:Ubiquitin-activating enzyme, putative n=1 Tax=Bodo saltans TaxID=75058 RepID=A0A0S4KJM6_BODSA|nr:ubiquitin-activating enzyme, putative [Bodo saltans]|eukprot:CUI14664.1 ubiquitin-activating enzyme, putative [Bodo saltans]